MNRDDEVQTAKVKEEFEIYLREKIVCRDFHVASLWKAMEYSLLAGGKRVRPILLILSGQSLGVSAKEIYPFAAALEMIHTYSLIHDDLPAMDNDDYRRGRLTNHKMFGEAGAILAGDGLLNLAYEIIAESLQEEISTRKAAAFAYLAQAAGASGMIAGQRADLDSEGKKVTLEELQYIERHKTGCLLTAPLVMAGLLAGIDADNIQRLERAGQAMGTAFQIWDDVLDVEGNFEELGKALHRDEACRKATFVSCFGLEEAKREAARLTQTALEELDFLPNEEGAVVRHLIEDLIIRRK